VKYQFEVMPKRHILQRQGFLPTEAGEESKESGRNDGASSDGDEQEIFAAVEEGKGGGELAAT
jgi:hypothetical protein